MSYKGNGSGATILVTGGGGYTGCVVTERLLARGYSVRVLDRLWWGEEPLAAVRDRIELIVADVREVPDTALDGVDAVIHLAGLANDPTAEHDPEANWDITVLATADLASSCLERGIERFVYASSASLYDGLERGVHGESAVIEPRGAYATAKHEAELRLHELVGDGLQPVIFRNGTLFGFSPRMRFDLVVHTFLKDALMSGELYLHGGGRMARPLADVRDAADAMIAAVEARAEVVSGEVFNVLHSNYQIRELAMIVAGSLQIVGRPVRLTEMPAPQLNRSYALSNRKLVDRLGFVPRYSVLDGVSDLLENLDLTSPARYAHPRYYNIGWLQLLEELSPRFERFSTVL
jgi:nucleoside-diphosphate-sugar epimerase